MLTSPPWLPPPESLTLSANVIHVWRVALDLPSSRESASGLTLSADEQERAARFVFEPDQRRYRLARAALRDVLAHYLSVRPETLQFRYTPHGKPALSEDAHANWLQFNLTHSHAWALIAVSYDQAVGIDVEHLRPIDAFDQLAARNFSAREYECFARTAAADQLCAFFNGWTRKEAYLKALGGGLALPLDQFDVSLAPDEPSALLNVQDLAGEAARWTLHALAPAPNYVAAVAVRATPVSFQYWHWPAL